MAYLTMVLSRRLLEELGHIAVVWSAIEQSMLLTVSALTSQDHDGMPTGDLRSDFKRLRELWWRESAKRLPKAHVDKVLQPLNMRLATAAKIRGDLMHGTWRQANRGYYTYGLWEQRKTLEFTEVTLPLRRIREIRCMMHRLQQDYIKAVS